MIKAFVFGKFLPFHKGHEALIRFALSNCDFLSVLVCCSDKERISGTIRADWIKASFEDECRLDVLVFNYAETELPNTSESSEEIAKLWSGRFKQLFTDYSLVITSEPYGSYVAHFMQIKHLMFDLDRKTVPVSATAIRKDRFAQWNYLTSSTRHYLALKVVLLGTESTGKSTLAERLARYYPGTLVKEAGRDLIPDSKNFEYEDLLWVAKEHADRILLAVEGNHPLIIIDTDVHITESYSRFMFSRELILEKAILDANKADLYLYLKNDVPYVEDGTRIGIEERNRLDGSHREVLQEAGIEFIEIAGNWDARFEQAVRSIDLLIHTASQEHYRIASNA